MADSGSYTPETIARRLKIAEALLGPNKKPITHWAEGLNELAQGYVGGQLYRKAEQSEKENDAAQTEALKGMLGVGSPATSSPVQSAPVTHAEPMGDLAGMPRGLRNNNPLNIEAGGFTQGQPGYAGSDGRFAKFASLDEGIGAADKLLGVYANKHGLNTVGGIVNRWAPPSDNNPTSAYASNVAKALGVAPDQPVDMADPGVRRQIIDAMAKFENGRPLSQGASSPPVQVAQAGGGDTRSAIINMLNSPNRAVQKQGRALAGSIIQKQLEGEKPTDDMREYEMARKQGFGGSLLDYQTKLKEAGKPVTNINQQQESEYQKSTGKQYAEMNNDIIKSSMNARGKVATLDRLGNLLSDPNITTGAGANTILEAKRMAKQLGFDVGDLGPAEAVRAISNQFALELRNPAGGAGMPGALSDKDREFLQASVPGLQQNPEGNKQIVDYMKRVANRSLEVEKLRQAYVKKNGRLDDGFFEVLSDFSEKNPLFPEASAAPVQQQAPTPQQSSAAPKAAPTLDDLLKKYGK